jgi:hypothetical protein
MFLPVFLVSQPAKAESSLPAPAVAEGFEINAGLNDAWVNPEAPFQGMFVTVFPDFKFVFVAWFTFDSEAPADDISAVIGAVDHRWITAFGFYEGDSVVLNAELTTGGRFNTSEPIAAQDTNYGTIAIEFTNCNLASVDFEFPGAGEAGSFTMSRIILDNVPLCEELANIGSGQASPVKDSPQALTSVKTSLRTVMTDFQINAGLNDAWVNNEAAFQGIFVTVLPVLKLMFAAWFTFDSEEPPVGATANIGAPDQRWITALGPYEGASAQLEAELTTGGTFNNAETIASQDPNYGFINLDFANCEEAMVSFDFPTAGQTGEFIINRVLPDNIALCEALQASTECKRPDPDESHGPNDPPIVDGAIVPISEIFGGGPGPDGIPPLEFPKFTQNLSSINLDNAELVVGVKIGNDVRAYPYNILNWHEVVNDLINIDGSPGSATLSYCPLTGSAVLWKSFMEPADPTFGTSGFLYNSNLIMYDRATESLWSQMLEQSIWGAEIKRIPDRLQVVETSWSTWKTMFPETSVLTRQTGFSRDYDEYPYGSYREDQGLLFPVDNMDDLRLHRKERVLGINVGSSSKVYPIKNFPVGVEVINDIVGDMQVVVAGSRNHNFGVVFNRETEDCTVLDFEAVPNMLPVIMRDNEGNEWDIFGTAVSGARTGQQLQKTNSYVSYWFAWTAFFQDVVIHQ